MLGIPFIGTCLAWLTDMLSTLCTLQPENCSVGPSSVPQKLLPNVIFVATVLAVDTVLASNEQNIRWCVK